MEKRKEKSELKEIRNILRMMLILLCQIKWYSMEDTEKLCNLPKDKKLMTKPGSSLLGGILRRNMHGL